MKKEKKESENLDFLHGHILLKGIFFHLLFIRNEINFMECIDMSFEVLAGWALCLWQFHHVEHEFQDYFVLELGFEVQAIEDSHEHQECHGLLHFVGKGDDQILHEYGRSSWIEDQQRLTLLGSCHWDLIIKRYLFLLHSFSIFDWKF